MAGRKLKFVKVQLVSRWVSQRELLRMRFSFLLGIFDRRTKPIARICHAIVSASRIHAHLDQYHELWLWTSESQIGLNIFTSSTSCSWNETGQRNNWSVFSVISQWLSKFLKTTDCNICFVFPHSFAHGRFVSILLSFLFLVNSWNQHSFGSAFGGDIIEAWKSNFGKLIQCVDH